MSDVNEESGNSSSEEEEELALPPNLIWRLALLIDHDSIKVLACREAQHFSVLFHHPDKDGAHPHRITFRDFQSILYDSLSQLPNPYIYLDHVGSFYVQENKLLLEAHFSSEEQILRCIESATFRNILCKSISVIIKAFKDVHFRVALVVCSSIDRKLRLVTKENACYAYELTYTQNPAFATFHIGDPEVYKQMKTAYDALLEYFPGFIGGMSDENVGVCKDTDFKEQLIPSGVAPSFEEVVRERGASKSVTTEQKQERPKSIVNTNTVVVEKACIDMSDREILDIAKEILPKRWQEVGVYLGLKHPQLEVIEVDNPGNVGKAIIDMLHKAKRSEEGNFRRSLAAALYQSHHRELAMKVDPSLETESFPKEKIEARDTTMPCLVHGELEFYDKDLADKHLKVVYANSFWAEMKNLVLPIIDEKLSNYSVQVLSAEVGSLVVKISISSYSSSLRLAIDIAKHEFVTDVEKGLQSVGYKETLEVSFKINGYVVNPGNCYSLYIQAIVAAMTSSISTTVENPSSLSLSHQNVGKARKEDVTKTDDKKSAERIKFKRVKIKPSLPGSFSASKQTSITAAIRAKDTEAVKRMIAQGTNLNKPEGDGNFPLHTAAMHGQAAVAQILVQNGAKLDSRTTTDEHYTPLHMAAHCGYLDVAKVLVDLGAEVDARSGSGKTPLRLAAAEGFGNVTEFLLSKGADPNSQDCLASTPLHVAASLNRKSVVNALINRGADITIVDNRGNTPIHEALKRKDVALLKLVLSKNPTAVNDMHVIAFEPPLTAACKMQNLEVTEFLLGTANADPNVQNKDHFTPLALASLLENMKLLDLLIKHGADISLITPQFGSVLHLCAQEGKVNATKKLLEYKIDCNMKDRHSYTPLRDAVLKEQHETALVLLNAGANTSLATPQGMLPLLNVAARKNDVKMLQILIEHECDVYQTPADGSTALHHAAASDINTSATLHYLCSKTKLINVRSQHGMTPLYSAIRQKNFGNAIIIMEYNPNVNICSYKGHSPLLLCIDFDSPIELVRQIVQHMALIHYPYETDIEGRPFGLKSPIELACRKGQAENLREMLQVNPDFLNQSLPALHHLLLFSTIDSGNPKALQVLLNYGIDPNAMVTEESISPLLKVCFVGDVDMLRVLLDGGAHPDLSGGEDGATPLIVACENEFIEVVEILIKSVNVNRKLRSNGYTALHKTASAGNPRIAEIIISNNAEIDIQSQTGLTPLHIAASAGNQEIVDILLHHNANFNIQDDAGTTPLIRAVQDCHPQIATLLIDAGADITLRAIYGLHVLHFAAFTGDIDTIEKISHQGVSLDVQDDNDTTPLHLVASKGMLNCTKILILKGASVNIVNNEDVAPLHLAVYNDCVEVVQFLMEHGANIELKVDGNTTANLSESKDMKKVLNEISRSNKDSQMPLVEQEKYATKEIDSSDTVEEVKYEISVYHSTAESKKSRPLIGEHGDKERSVAHHEEKIKVSKLESFAERYYNTFINFSTSWGII